MHVAHELDGLNISAPSRGPNRCRGIKPMCLNGGTTQRDDRSLYALRDKGAAGGGGFFSFGERVKSCNLLIILTGGDRRRSGAEGEMGEHRAAAVIHRPVIATEAV